MERQVFFYIKHGVIPAPFQWMVLGLKEKIAEFPPLVGFKDQDWYKTLCDHATPLMMDECPESVLNLLGISLICPEGQDPNPPKGIEVIFVFCLIVLLCVIPQMFLYSS